MSLFRGGKTNLGGVTKSSLQLVNSSALEQISGFGKSQRRAFLARTVENRCVCLPEEFGLELFEGSDLVFHWPSGEQHFDVAA